MKSIKKSFVIAIIAFMIIGLFGGVVNAASASVNVKASKTAPKVGDTVTVTVSFSVPVGTATLDLNYNNNVLQYVSSNAWKAKNNGNSVRLNYIDANFENKTIKSMTVTFKVKAEGTATCSVSGVTISDAEANELTANVGNGATIKAVKAQTSSGNNNKKPNSSSNTSNKTDDNQNSEENTIVPEEVVKQEAPNELIRLEDESAKKIEDENTKIIIKAADIALEDNTILQVEKIEIGNENYAKIEEILKDVEGNKICFNIQLLKDDVLVQPNGYVTVFVPIPEEYNKENLEMYNVDIENGTYKLIQGEVQGNYYTFTANHFSTYVLVEKPEPKTFSQTVTDVFNNLTVLYAIIAVLVLIVIIETIVIIKKRSK